MSKTDLTNTVEWNTINWRKVQKVVFKLQKRIYQASIAWKCQKRRENYRKHSLTPITPN